MSPTCAPCGVSAVWSGLALSMPLFPARLSRISRTVGACCYDDALRHRAHAPSCAHLALRSHVGYALPGTPWAALTQRCWWWHAPTCMWGVCPCRGRRRMIRCPRCRGDLSLDAHQRSCSPRVGSRIHAGGQMQGKVDSFESSYLCARSSLLTVYAFCL